MLLCYCVGSERVEVEEEGVGVGVGQRVLSDIGQTYIYIEQAPLIAASFTFRRERGGAINDNTYNWCDWSSKPFLWGRGEVRRVATLNPAGLDLLEKEDGGLFPPILMGPAWRESVATRPLHARLEPRRIRGQKQKKGLLQYQPLPSEQWSGTVSCSSYMCNILPGDGL